MSIQLLVTFAILNCVLALVYGIVIKGDPRKSIGAGVVLQSTLLLYFLETIVA